MSDHPFPPDLNPEDEARAQHMFSEMHYRLRRARTGIPYDASITCDKCGQEMPYHETLLCESCRRNFAHLLMGYPLDARLLEPPYSVVQPIPLDEIMNTHWNTTPADPLLGEDHLPRPVAIPQPRRYPFRWPFDVTLPAKPNHLRRCQRVAVLFALGVLVVPAYKTV